MFTGIVEEIGIVKGISKGEKSSKLIIQGTNILEDTKVGDSICTNGVCLTVTSISKNKFSLDVMAETLRMSNLGDLNVNSKVNLERALTLKSRLGGHIVIGHIDGTGIIKSIVREDTATWIELSVEEDILRYIILKGSITIDGISLTVAKVLGNSFKVSIIPHTGTETTLLSKEIGETVNIECDIIGKYVEKLLGVNNKKDITEDFLRENGFL